MSVNTKEIFVEVEKPILAKEAVLNLTEEIDKKIEAYFTKSTSKTQLETIKKQLATKGVTLEIKTIKRNKNGIITNIKLTFSSENGEVSYAEKDKDGIDSFVFLMNDDSMEVKAAEIIEEIEIVEEVETPLIIEETPEVETETETEVVIEQQPRQTVRANYTFVSSDTLVINKPVIKANGNVKVRTNTFTIKTDSVNYDNSFKFKTSSGKDPIIILDGKRVTEKELKKLNPQSINKLEVHKDEKAIQLYGNDGKDGVIVITSKKKGIDNGTNSWGVTVGDNKTFPEASKKQLYTFISDNEKPLIIVNDETIGKLDIKDLDHNMIKSLSVFKGKKAVELYGKSGQDGVIVIVTKDAEASAKLRKPNETVALSSIKFVDDKDDSKNATIYYINKNSKESNLEQVVTNLKKLGIVARFSKIKRNRKGEIIAIKVSLSDNNGGKSSATFKNNKTPIPAIAVGKSGDSLIASSSPNFQD